MVVYSINMSLIFQTFTTYCFIIALEEFTTQIIYIQLLEYIILYHRLLPKASCEKCFFLPTMNFRNGFPVLLTSYEITYRKLVCRRLFLVYISRLQSRLLGAYSCEGSYNIVCLYPLQYHGFHASTAIRSFIMLAIFKT
jgi:hypothetical protein